MSTDTDTPVDLIVSKIAKLWRKANDPGATEAERQAFEAKALSLMEENRITESMLDLGYEDVLGDYSLGKLTGRNARLRIDLADAIARAYDCRVYWSNWGLTYDVCLFGFKSDVERVKALFTMLDADCASRAQGETGIDMAHTKNLRRSFAIGYRRAIDHRLREAKIEAARVVEEERVAEVAEHADEFEDEILGFMCDDDMSFEEAVEAVAKRQMAGSALVLVDRSKQVESKYAQKKMRHAGGIRGAGHGDAVARGRAAGQSANLHRASSVSGSRGALASA